ncbi:MAG: zinc ABC transporter substrate-binding protein [Bacilli bacterium]|nr:zinc ABC transporter substrate-binding protein [Bacilli bacterium]
MKKKLLLFVLIPLCIFIMCLTTSCNGDDEEVDIYASIYPMYYLTQKIVGDKMVVKQLYPDGIDVHEYDPVVDGDMKVLVKMSKAKLLFYISDRLEAFISSAKTTVLANSDLKTVELTKNVRLYDSVTEEYETTEDHGMTVDLHIWLDPILMQKMAKIISKEVCEIDPDNTTYYEANLANVLDILDKIDKKYQEELQDFEFRTMLVDHDAYLYLAKRYELTRIKTRVDNESCDINPIHMINTMEEAKSLGIEYIVVTKNESVCSSVDSFVNELGCEVVYLDPISTLTIETQEFDYYDLMINNLYVLKKIFR